MAENTIKATIKAEDGGSLKKVSRNMDRVSASTKEAEGETRHLEKAMLDFNRQTVKGFKQNAFHGNALVATYARIASTMFAVSSAVRVFQAAADFGILTKSVEEFSIRSGASIQGLVSDMKNITKGAVDFNTIMKSATLGTSAGLGTDTLKKLTVAATDASRAMGVDLTDSLNRVFRGVIKAEPELLDELGIILRLTTASEKYGAAIGKTANELTTFEKQQAVANEVLDQAERKFGGISDNVPVNELARLVAVSKDTGMAALVSVLDLMNPVLKAVADNIDLMSSALFLLVGQGLKAFLGLKDGMVGFAERARVSMKVATDALVEYQKQAALTGTTRINSIEDGGLFKLGSLKKAIARGETVGVDLAKAVAKGIVSKDARATIRSSLEDTLKKATSSGVSGATTFELFPASGVQGTVAESKKLITALNNLDKMSVKAALGLKKTKASIDAIKTRPLSAKLTVLTAKLKKMGLEARKAFSSGKLDAATSGLKVKLFDLSNKAGILGKSMRLAGIAAAGFGSILTSGIPAISGMIFSLQLLKDAIFFLGDAFGLSSQASRDFVDSLKSMGRDLDTMDKASTRLSETLETLPDGLEKSVETASISLNLLSSQLSAVRKISEGLSSIKSVGSSGIKEAANTLERIVENIPNSKIKSELGKVANTSFIRTEKTLLNVVKQVDKAISKQKSLASEEKEFAENRLRNAAEFNTLLRKSADSILPKATADMKLQVGLQIRLRDLAKENISLRERSQLLNISFANIDDTNLNIQNEALKVTNKLKDTFSSLGGLIQTPGLSDFVENIGTDIAVLAREGTLSMDTLTDSIFDQAEASGFLEDKYSIIVRTLLNLIDGNATLVESLAGLQALQEAVGNQGDIARKKANEELRLINERVSSTNTLKNAELALSLVSGLGTTTSIKRTQQLLKVQEDLARAKKASFQSTLTKFQIGSKAGDTNDGTLKRNQAQLGIDTLNLELVALKFKTLNSRATEFSAIVSRINSERITGVTGLLLAKKLQLQIDKDISELRSNSRLDEETLLAIQEKRFGKAQEQLIVLGAINKLEGGRVANISKLLGSTKSNKNLKLERENLKAVLKLSEDRLSNAELGNMQSDKELVLARKITDAKGALAAAKKLSEEIGIPGTLRSLKASRKVKQVQLELNNLILERAVNEKKLRIDQQTAAITSLTNLRDEVSLLEKSLFLTKEEAAVQKSVLALKQQGIVATPKDEEIAKETFIAQTKKDATSGVLDEVRALQETKKVSEDLKRIAGSRLFLTTQQMEVERRISLARVNEASESSISKLRNELEANINTQNIEDSLETVRSAIDDTGTELQSAFVDTFSSFLKTGEFNFSSFAQNMSDMMSELVADLLFQWARLAIIGDVKGGSSSSGLLSILGTVITGAIGGIGNTSAVSAGSAGTDNGIVAAGLGNSGSGFAKNLFARGGIADQPSIFGEAGPEAAVPLPDGRTIPVTIKEPTVRQDGSNIISINVTVDSNGNSQVSSEQKAGDKEFREKMEKTMGEGLAMAIKTEMINQQRPGGILSTNNSSRNFRR